MDGSAAREDIVTVLPLNKTVFALQKDLESTLETLGNSDLQKTFEILM